MNTILKTACNARNGALKGERSGWLCKRRAIPHTVPIKALLQATKTAAMCMAPCALNPPASQYLLLLTCHEAAVHILVSAVDGSLVNQEW